MPEVTIRRGDFVSLTDSEWKKLSAVTELRSEVKVTDLAAQAKVSRALSLAVLTILATRGGATMHWLLYRARQTKPFKRVPWEKGMPYGQPEGTLYEIMVRCRAKTTIHWSSV